MSLLAREKSGLFLLDIYPLLYRLGNIGLRLTKLPILGRLVGETVIDTRGSNVSYIPVQENLELPEGIVAPVSIVEHFIRVASHRFIMAYCPCRSANDCSSHPQDIGCIWLGEATATIDVPPGTGRHVGVDEAIEHLHRARDEGLTTIIGKFKPDPLAMGVGKDHKRFMTICNCCSCCCMVNTMRYGRPEFKKIIHRLQGLVMKVDRDKCEGCGECAEACIFGHITLTDGKPFFSDECKGCGFCALACPNQAISIKIEDPSFIEEALSRISGAVDVT